ncbi:MAG: sigma-70 family RNA polymerase sigma factor [Isosphaeraceae bacterium]
MGAVMKMDVSDALENPGTVSTALLGPKRERQLFTELAGCKRTLVEAITRGLGQVVPEQTDHPRAMSRLIAESYHNDGPVEGELEAVFQRYFELRAELALTNTRLVASVAKRYRNRGVAYSDLIQEGFCGLLEAIDRFDLAHQTKLSTYATWWIRQAVQSAVSEGAYPVRLSPRHLRQLAQNQDELDRQVEPDRDQPYVATPSIQRIHAATRPSVSLSETRSTSLHSTSVPERDLVDDSDVNETVGKWMNTLRPRERQVLSYRFGLGGSPRLSLSQVGEILDVSKERVRQIQDAALKMLRKNVPIDSLISTN